MKKKTNSTEAVMWVGSTGSFEAYEASLLRAHAVTEEIRATIEAKLNSETDGTRREYQSPLIDVTDGIAVINVNGSLTNETGDFLIFYGMTPYTMIYDAVIEAALDDRIDATLLAIDSNGGTVAGISHALEGLREAAQIKPIYTHTASNMNSAAYWIGSAGSHVMADRMAEVGSIGVIAMMADYTEAMKQQGITPHVFRAGEFKALGNPYEAMDEKAAKSIQDRIDARYEQFLEDVAINRGYTKDVVKERMAEGRVFLAKDAETVGLIDSVMSFNDAYRYVKADIAQSGNSQLRGIHGFSANASGAELPIHSHEGETMKKKVVNEMVLAAVAEGANLAASLEAMGTEVDESAEGAVVTPEAEGAEVAEVTKEVAPVVAAPVDAEAVAGTNDGIMALVNKVGDLSQALAEANSDLKSYKAKADVAESQVGSLKTIAADSITRMGIALGQASQDLSAMSTENLLTLHASTRAEFNKRLPVGQHVVTEERDEAVDQAADNLNNRLAGLTTKQ